MAIDGWLWKKHSNLLTRTTVQYSSVLLLYSIQCTVRQSLQYCTYSVQYIDSLRTVKCTVYSALYSTVQRSNTVQYCTIQYSTYCIQYTYSTVLYVGGKVRFFMDSDHTVYTVLCTLHSVQRCFARYFKLQYLKDVHLHVGISGLR